MKTPLRPPGRIHKHIKGFKKMRLTPTPTQQIALDRIRAAETSTRNLVLGVPLEEQ